MGSGRGRARARSGGVRSVGGQGERDEQDNGAGGRGDDSGFVQLLQAAMEVGGTRTHSETERQGVCVLEGLLDTMVHGPPQ
ncbi:hypothetical protein B1218_35235, partial [Pseudomonas ogarae]